MCRDVPGRRVLAAVAVALLVGAGALRAQNAEPPLAGRLLPDWRQIGNSIVDRALASPASGPVSNVWFVDGARLAVRTSSGRILEMDETESWRPAPGLAVPDSLALEAVSLPEPGARLRGGDGAFAPLYAFGRDVYRSDDGGRSWSNRTAAGSESLLGDAVLDLVVSPLNADMIVAVNRFGVWRSLDGGLSWAGLNDGLPNLPVRRILQPPAGSRGARILLEDGSAVEWTPGEKQSWRPADGVEAALETSRRSALSARLGRAITVLSEGAQYSYAGAADGSIWISWDRGQTWRWSHPEGAGEVKALYAAPPERRVAVAALGAAPGDEHAPRLLRSFDGGANWEDLTGDLPPGEAHGVAASESGRAVYAATDAGVYMAVADPGAGPGAARWIRLSDALPAARAVDVALDAAGNQLYAALEGYGVFAAPAPHRFWEVAVVDAADLERRPASPGGLLTVLGGQLLRAQAGLLPAPVLHASASASQIQLPFELSGAFTLLTLDLSQGRFSVRLPLRQASPAIFVDPDGTPLLIDGETGVLLDRATPARSGMRVQILATGLGRVRPEWLTGAAAPLERPPRVVTPVRAYLDGFQVEVVRAVLAPGYVGFYLVEARLPAVVNPGPAELYLEAGGSESNRVRIYLEP